MISLQRIAALTLSGAAAATASLGTAQQTWIVDSIQRPGHDFIEISDAIVAVAPGDTLLVRSAGYQSFVATRAINIIGEDNVTVHGAFHVRDLPTGETVAIRNVGTGFAIPQNTIGLRLLNNAGSVLLHGVRFVPGFGGEPVVDACANVSFSSCSLECPDNGLQVLNSVVQFDGGTIRRSPSFGVGGVAMTCTASTVHIGATEIRGVDQTFFLATDAIRVHSGTVTVGAGARIIGGQSGGPTSAIDTTGGEIVLDPSATIQAGGGGVAIAGPATQTLRTVPTTHVTSAVADGTFAGTTHAPAGSSIVVLVGIPAPRIPTPFGDLWALGPLTVVDSGSVPQTGERSFSLQTGASTPDGFVLTAQSVALHNSELWLSTPSSPVLKR